MAVQSHLQADHASFIERVQDINARAVQCPVGSDDDDDLIEDHERIDVQPKHSNVKSVLTSLGFDAYLSKFEAIGIRCCSDLHFVEDDDLVQWGLTTVQRRKFFRWRDVTLPSREIGSSLFDDLPPPPPSSRNMQSGIMCGIQLPKNGDIHNALLKLSVRVLARTGPQSLASLRGRLECLECRDGLMSQMRDDVMLELLSSVAHVTPNSESASAAIVSVRQHFQGSDLFSLETVVWSLGQFLLRQPEEILRLALTCKDAQNSGLAQSQDLWLQLLRFWYPRASLEDPAAEEDRLGAREAEANKNDAIVRRLEHKLDKDTPVRFFELWQHSQGDDTKESKPLPNEVLRLLARFPNNFKQQTGCTLVDTLFCREVEFAHGQWLPVNPYQDVASLCNERELAIIGEARSFAAVSKDIKGKRLHPKDAFRLFRSGLLTQNVSHERSQIGGRGRERGTPLRSWQYVAHEGAARGVRPASEILDEAERGVRAIRMSDPSRVHGLVIERLDGVVYHVVGCFNRRVQILTSALLGGHLSLEREKRKQLERKLLEFMEKVRKERAFGYYYCRDCGSRWRSGFTYEEMGQECLKCGALVKPFRITELDDKYATQARKNNPAKLVENPRRLRLLLGGKNAKRSVTFFAKVESDLSVLAQKYELDGGQIVHGEGASWQLELCGDCSAEVLVELTELLKFHDLCILEEPSSTRWQHETKTKQLETGQWTEQAWETTGNWWTQGWQGWESQPSDSWSHNYGTGRSKNIQRNEGGNTTRSKWREWGGQAWQTSQI